MRLFQRERPGLPAGWRSILAARSAHWPLLAPDEQDRLGELADHILRTKRWEAARGQDLTDEVRTLVAGHAALLALGLDESAFDGVGTIVVRSRAMRRAAPMAGPAQGVLMDAPGAVDGEAHHADGPIMLVWPSARREARNPRLGRDVVIHEFSHKLDMLDGTLDGTPPMTDPELRDRWVEVCTTEYHAVRDGTSACRPAAVRRDEPGRVLRRRDRDVLHPTARPAGRQAGAVRRPRRVLPPGPGAARAGGAAGRARRGRPAWTRPLARPTRRARPAGDASREDDRPGVGRDRSEHVGEIAVGCRLRREVGAADAIEAEPAPGAAPATPRHQVPVTPGSLANASGSTGRRRRRRPVTVDVVDDDHDLSPDGLLDDADGLRRPDLVAGARPHPAGQRRRPRPAARHHRVEHLGQRPAALGRVRRRRPARTSAWRWRSPRRA